MVNKEDTLRGNNMTYGYVRKVVHIPQKVMNKYDQSVNLGMHHFQTNQVEVQKSARVELKSPRLGDRQDWNRSMKIYIYIYT